MYVDRREGNEAEGGGDWDVINIQIEEHGHRHKLSSHPDVPLYDLNSVRHSIVT